MGASDITLATSIKRAANSTAVQGKAGAVILAGQVCYFDSSDSTWKLAIGTSAAAANAGGIALNSCPAIGQPLELITEGDITGVSGLTAGETYVVSDATAGALMLADDLGTGDYATFILIPTAATTAKIKILVSGVVHG